MCLTKDNIFPSFTWFKPKKVYKVVYKTPKGEYFTPYQNEIINLNSTQKVKCKFPIIKGIFSKELTYQCVHSLSKPSKIFGEVIQNRLCYWYSVSRGGFVVFLECKIPPFTFYWKESTYLENAEAFGSTKLKIIKEI